MTSCIAPLEDGRLCGAPATTGRLIEGLVCPLCEEHAREVDAPEEDEMETETETTAMLYQITYTPAYAEFAAAALPERVEVLDDGRALATYAGGRQHVYASLSALGSVHPYTSSRSTGEARTVRVPPMPVTYAAGVDWAAIHHAAAEVDRARYGTRIGCDGLTNALGGSYHHTAYGGLVGLVRLITSVARIADDAWGVVHEARFVPDGIDRARQACRVAIACSRLFALLHTAGLIDDPAHRICGTGPGYGLTGLRWLAGAAYDDGCTREQVEAFAAGGSLPDC